MLKTWLTDNSGAGLIVAALMGFVAAVGLMDSRLVALQKTLSRDIMVVREDVREIRSVMFIPFRPGK